MGFSPLAAQTTEPRAPRSGFTPLEPVADDPEEQLGGVFHPALETVKEIGEVYPALEAGANLATQMVALPVAGIAGLGAAATKALGLTDTEPSDVVHKVGGALTYQPQTEAGKHFTETATLPFKYLQQAGEEAGDKTLDATGSPAAAAAVDTAVQSLPMLAGVKGKGRGTVRSDEVRSEVRSESAGHEVRTGFTPVNETMAQTHQEAPQGVFVRSDISAPTAGTENAPTARNSVPPEIVTAYELAKDGITTDGGKPSAILQAGDILHRAGAIQDAEGFARVADDIKAIESLGLPEDARQVALKGVVKKHLQEAKNARNEQSFPERVAGLAAPVEALPRSDGQGFPELRGARDQGLPAVDQQFSAIPSGRWAEAEPGPLDMAGQAGRERQLRAEQLPVGETYAADFETAVLSPGEAGRPGGNHSGNGPEYRYSADDDAQALAGDGVRTGEIGDQGTAALPQGFSPLQPERANHEPAGVGEVAWREGANSEGTFAPRDAIGTGIDSRPFVKVAGKPVTEHSDAALERLSMSRLISEDARARVNAEMVRRAEVSKAEVSTPVSMETGVNRAAVSSEVNRESLGVTKQDVTADVTAKTPVTADAVTDGVTAKAPVTSDMVSKPVSTESMLNRPNLNSMVNTETDSFNRMVSGKVSAETMPDSAVDSRASWAPGANYTGFVDRAETAGKLADKPIRREDVLIPLMRALDTRIYEGRVRGKNRLGTFTPTLEAVRIKRKGDIEVAAHEIAHMLDDRIPEIRKSWTQGPLSAEYAKELRGVSYDSKKVYEGFAEFMRLYMTQPEKARAAAPNFSKWFDNFTNRHEYGPAIKKAQADMTAWQGQDALHRAQSKIGTSKELNKALDGIGDQFRQSVLDDLHGVMRMERQMTGKTSPVGVYETARLTRGAYAMTDGAIRMGYPVRKADGSFAFEGKGLEKILEPVSGNLDEFLMYAVGKSSQELMGQGREHLFTPAEVNSMVQLERPEYRKAFADYQTWNKGVLDFAESMGIINPQSRAMWQRTQYLPFYRVGEAGATKKAGGVEGNWHGINKLTGGSGNLRDILGNMTQNASMLISAALRNEARAKIAELAEQPGGGQFMVKIAGDAKPVRIDREQVSKAVLEALGLDKATIKGNPEAAKLADHAKLIEQQIMASPGMFEFFQHNQAPRGNVMAVLKDGRPTYYEVADPLLMRAISALERPAQHWLVKLLGIPKRIGQMSITLTPDFMVANIARDTIMGSVMSRGGFIPVLDSLKGMASRIAKDDTYREFIANGGGMASHLLDETNMRAHLERFYTSKGINLKTVLDAPDKLMYGIETIADAFEMSTRLGEYKRLREQGVHPRHAAYAAREISTDFSAGGDSKTLGFLYSTAVFLRPAVLSMDRLYRGLAHDPNKGAIAAKSAAIAGMSAALYLLNRENPKYQDLEDWDRDNYFHFFIPRADGSSVHFRYPKIWEVGALASVAERTMQHTLDGDPLGYGKESARILGNLFNLNLTPQVIAPLAEQAANRNSFTNRPIETQGMEDMQPFMRAKPYTSETLKAAGMATRDLPESLQVNPVRAEALVRGYFNTWGMYGLMLADQAFFGDKMPERSMDQMPVVRRFYEGDPATHTRFETEFYDMLGEAKRLHNTMKALDKMNRPEIATEIEQRPMTGMDKQLERASKELHGINGDMLEARRSDLTPAEKRQRLDALTVEKNALLKEVVLDVKAQQREVAR